MSNQRKVAAAALALIVVLAIALTVTVTLLFAGSEESTSSAGQTQDEFIADRNEEWSQLDLYDVILFCDILETDPGAVRRASIQTWTDPLERQWIFEFYTEKCEPWNNLPG